MSDDRLSAFDRSFVVGDRRITRIGAGEIGGKARGLVLFNDRIVSRVDVDRFPYVEVGMPTTAVIGTAHFDAFMSRNDLYPIALSSRTDDRLAHAFLRAELPAELSGDLRALVASVQTPLAIRSSSLLEDALEHPFAGVYATKMIPNNEHDIDARFHRLVEAVKLVWASTFFAGARSYIRSVGQSIESEKMAVIIQEVVGRRYGDRFYPHISGVARSYNFYPTGHGNPRDGVVNLALGLGMTIVDGGLSWTYCPAFPRSPPPFNNIGDLLKNTQTRFWAVHMGAPPVPDPIRETECLVEADLTQAEKDGVLKFLVSTYDARSDRLNAGLGGGGPRALTFAPILGSRLFPINDLIHTLLRLSEDALESEVELELALDLHPVDGLPARLGFLQVRPMRVVDDDVAIEPDDLEAPGVIVASENVLGNGVREGIEDVVFIKPEVFDPAQTPRIAMELDRINESLVREDRSYLLIGFGRWGSSDPWLGVPIAWGQISGARVIVEATLPRMSPDLSQGSHFFHNLLSFQILYLSVEHRGPYGIDWEWLDRQHSVAETEHVKHVRCARALSIAVDSARGRGVVRHDDAI
jgi:hypothetical protein